MLITKHDREIYENNPTPSQKKGKEQLANARTALAVIEDILKDYENLHITNPYNWGINGSIGWIETKLMELTSDKMR